MTALHTGSVQDRIGLGSSGRVSDAELPRLFARAQADRDPEARRLLVERFLPLARKLARRYAGTGEPLEDLVGVANLALVKAIDRFDPGRGMAFSSFAVPTILGELRRHFRDTGWDVHVPRGMQERAQQVTNASKALAVSGQEPSPQILAEYLEWPLEGVIEALEAAAGHHSSSLDAPVSDEDGEVGTMLGTVGAVDSAYEAVEARLTFAQALSTLPAYAREVVGMRFVEDLTQAQIGARLGVSQMQISRVLRDALKQIREVTDGAF